MRSKNTLVLVLFHLVTICVFPISALSETASFYGGSYISIPYQDAKSTTEINLKFRTKQADAFLFLAAGKTDYCLLKLQSGKLKVHLNLGAGEFELSSPKGVRLDDLVWHHVSLNRKDADVNVTVDKIHTIREKLPGKYFELNIYDGLFLGGSGDSLDLFLGHFEWLRGCLSTVIYNGIDVLRRARYRTSQADVHSVSWSCSSEFDATFNNDISFVEDAAFLSLPNPISRIGVRWRFELKTTSENAIIVYSSKLVQGGRYDYVGLELSSKKLRLVMDTGSGMAEVFSDVNVTDGDWHLVTIKLSPVIIEIQVDGNSTSSVRITSKTGNKYLDLSDIVYVGGLELNKRSNALLVGMKSADKSLKGCMRSMEADGKLLGFPNVKVSQGTLPNCIWNFPCARNPCNNNSTCLQHGVDSFRCICDDEMHCKNSTYSDKTTNSLSTKVSLPVALEILSLNPVHAVEGESVQITNDNIDVILDYPKYGIREMGVVFTIVQMPNHGTVNVGSNDLIGINSDLNNMFTLLDLSNDKIQYVHDGSENYNDSMIIELEFTSSTGFVLTNYLQGKHLFLLNVDIAPINDPPLLFIAPGKVLRLAEGTRKVITNSLVNATDSDNTNAEITLTVLNQSTNGFVAKLKAPSTAINTFSQEEIDFGEIIFVHYGNTTNDDKISLQASDGFLTSTIAYLRISGFRLNLNLVNNTGITLAKNSYVIITSDNLFFKTNAEDPLLDIKYQISEFPKYGVIQCLTRSKVQAEMWQTVSSFTDRQISKEEVKYMNTEDTTSTFDLFKFHVSAKNLVLPDEYEFKLNFVQLSMKIVANITVDFENIQRIAVNESNLKVLTHPLPTNSNFIVYTMIKTSYCASLMIGNRILVENSTWTQRDLHNGKVSLKLHRPTLSSVEDYFTFSVNAPQCNQIDELRLNFKYQPNKDDMNSVRLYTKPIQVNEGGQEPFVSDNLNLIKENVSRIIYYIVEGPNHGWLEMYDIDHTTIERRDFSKFENSDIIQQRISFTHDDSESAEDFLRLVATDEFDSFQFIFVLHIEILLKNDNPPYCIVNNGLNVVIGGEKILSSRDLLYGDADINADSKSITYSRRIISNNGNGVFYLSHSPYTQLTEFTQDDINKGNIQFRHNGNLTSQIPMLVSDGKTIIELNFTITASQPYVKITNNSKLSMRQGSHAVLTSINLLATTNINVPNDKIQKLVTVEL